LVVSDAFASVKKRFADCAIALLVLAKISVKAKR